MITSPTPHPVSIATLAATLRPAATMWFTKSEWLALEELIRLAQRWEDHAVRGADRSVTPSREMLERYVTNNNIRHSDGTLVTPEYLAKLLGWPAA